MGVISSDITWMESASTTLTSLLTTGFWEVVEVDGLRVRGMGLYKTEMSRCTKTPCRAVTMFSIKIQYIVGEETFLAHLPHVCRQHHA